MAQDGIDCLVVPNDAGQGTTSQAAGRYLTQIGGGSDSDVAVIFPGDDEPTVITGDPAQWIASQPWCTDLRAPVGSYATTVVSRLHEVIPRRVGIVGQATASYAFVQHLFKQLPAVEWVDFSYQMEAIRSVKGIEEIAFLEQAAQLVDAAYDATLGALQPGVPERHVWAAAVEALCSGGSEPPVNLSWVGGEHPDLVTLGPTWRAIAPGWLFLTEVEAAWGGYRARRAQPFACGEPDPLYADLIRLMSDVWDEMLPRLQPGAPLLGLTETLAATCTRLKPLTGPIAGATTSLALEGCGLGSDLPRMPETGSLPSTAPSKLRLGWCFSCRLSGRAGRYHLVWSEPVAITARGPRRLSSAPPQIRVARW
jgi:Xaa-Pro aminopeptidase